MTDHTYPERRLHQEPQSAARVRLRRLVAASFVSFLAWVIYLANTGQKDTFPMNVAVLPHSDKVGHVVLYGLLALVLGAACNFRQLRFRRFRWDLGAYAATLFACLEEASQYLSPHRTPDMLDLACGFFGIWCARKLFTKTRCRRR